MFKRKKTEIQDDGTSRDNSSINFQQTTLVGSTDDLFYSRGNLFTQTGFLDTYDKDLNILRLKDGNFDLDSLTKKYKKDLK